MAEGRRPTPELLPAMPAQDTVVLPQVVSPLHVTRSRHLALLDEVRKGDGQLAFFLEREGTRAMRADDVHRIGTSALLLEVRELPDSTRLAVVRGLERVRLQSLVRTEPYWVGRVSEWPDVDEGGPNAE